MAWGKYRNLLCRCGSEVKYKYCHWQEDSNLGKYEKSQMAFRCHVSTLDLHDSMQVIGAYFDYLEDNKPIPGDIEIDPSILNLKKPNRGVYEWDLIVILREVLVLAKSGKENVSLKRWPQMLKVISAIKNTNNKRDDFTKENLPYILIRYSYQQFAWQRGKSLIPIYRSYAVFSEPRINNLFDKYYGINVQDYFQVLIGLWAWKHNTAPGVYLFETPVDFSKIGVRRSAVEKVIADITLNIDDLKILVDSHKRYYGDFEYSFSPFREYPMISVGDNVSYIPSSNALIWMLSDGIYYKLIEKLDATDNSLFGNALGDAIESYVERILAKTKHQVIPQDVYGSRSASSKTVDFILKEDDRSCLFVEVKSTRPVAEYFYDTECMESEIEAKIVPSLNQMYKQLWNYKDRQYPVRSHDGLNPCDDVYPILLTYAEWELHHHIIPIIESKLIEYMKVNGNSHLVDLVEEHKFTIASMGEFEIMVPYFDTQGISSVMSEKTTSEYWSWSLLNCTKERFGSMEISKYFEEEDDLVTKIFPNMSK